MKAFNAAILDHAAVLVKTRLTDKANVRSRDGVLLVDDEAKCLVWFSTDNAAA